MKKILTFLFLINSIIPAYAGQDVGDIIIKIKDFKNNDGIGIVYLWDNPAGYPLEVENAIEVIEVNIKNQAAEVVFKDRKYGEYAIGMIHDENLDGELETNFIGIPKEGFAVSNNATGNFGPPDFADTKFILESQNKQLFLNVVN